MMIMMMENLILCTGSGVLGLHPETSRDINYTEKMDQCYAGLTDSRTRGRIRTLALYVAGNLS